MYSTYYRDYETTKNSSCNTYFFTYLISCYNFYLFLTPLLCDVGNMLKKLFYHYVLLLLLCKNDFVHPVKQDKLLNTMRSMRVWMNSVRATNEVLKSPTKRSSIYYSTSSKTNELSIASDPGKILKTVHTLKIKPTAVSLCIYFHP